MARLKPERFDRDGEVMTIAKHPVVTASLVTSVYDIVHIMAREGFRRIPILDPRTEALQWIVTAMDIVRLFGSGEVFQHLRSGTILQVLQTAAIQIGTSKLIIISSNVDVDKATRTMKERNAGALLVVDDEKLVGILTERDFFKLANTRAISQKLNRDTRA